MEGDEMIITTQKIPIKLWLNDIEEGAMEQAMNLANLPFAFKHVAVMPDAHQGYGMPIGGVLATQKVVIPNAVGVDIGCGMCAVKTVLTEMPMELIKKIFGGSKEHQGGIRSRIPVGRNHHSKAQADKLMPVPTAYCDGVYPSSLDYPVVYQEYKSALKQLGTLGGGNHFLDALAPHANGPLHFLIHTGSRSESGICKIV